VALNEALSNCIKDFGMILRPELLLLNNLPVKPFLVVNNKIRYRSVEML
jgi:hypothetical protein